MSQDIVIDIHTHITEDGAHSEWFWAREFPAAIRWINENKN